jgi:hypothetical protein
MLMSDNELVGPKGLQGEVKKTFNNINNNNNLFLS